MSVDITNSGIRAGDEVVQLCVKHSDAKVAWPNEELKGLQRVSLQPGETTTVQLPLAAKSLAYLDEAQVTFVVLEEPVTLRLAVPRRISGWNRRSRSCARSRNET